jgi:hypothetical protein
MLGQRTVTLLDQGKEPDASCVRSRRNRQRARVRPGVDHIELQEQPPEPGWYGVTYLAKGSTTKELDRAVLAGLADLPRSVLMERSAGWMPCRVETASRAAPGVSLQKDRLGGGRGGGRFIGWRRRMTNAANGI